MAPRVKLMINDECACRNAAPKFKYHDSTAGGSSFGELAVPQKL